MVMSDTKSLSKRALFSKHYLMFKHNIVFCSQFTLGRFCICLRPGSIFGLQKSKTNPTFIWCSLKDSVPYWLIRPHHNFSINKKQFETLILKLGRTGIHNKTNFYERTIFGIFISFESFENLPKINQFTIIHKVHRETCY